MPVAGRLVSASVLLQDGAHSLVLVRYDFSKLDRAKAFLLAERQPVTLVYGQADESQTFYGYIHHHEIYPTEGNSRVTVEYTFIGTSLPLNQQRTRSWGKVSASYIARTIAAEHGFSAYVHRSGRVFEYLAQEGVSDLQMLKRIADEAGFRFWCHNGTLWFVSPDIFLAGPKSKDVPKFYMNQTTGVKDSIRSVQVVAGSMVQDGGVLSNRRIYGYDPRNQTFLEAHDHQNDAFLSVVDKKPVSSLSEAYAALESARVKNRNWLVARAQVDGDSRLQPGSMVQLVGAGLPVSAAGYWLVTKAAHDLDLGLGRDQNSEFTTTLDLVRDTETKVTFSDFHQLSPDQEYPQARLSDRNLWEAALIEEQYLG